MLSRRAVGALVAIAIVIAAFNFIALLDVEPTLVYERLSSGSAHLFSTTTSVHLKGSSRDTIHTNTNGGHALSTDNGVDATITLDSIRETISSDTSEPVASVDSASEPSSSQVPVDTATTTPTTTSDAVVDTDDPLVRDDNTRLDTDATDAVTTAAATVDVVTAVPTTTKVDSTQVDADTSDAAAAEATAIVATPDTIDTIALDVVDAVAPDTATTTDAPGVTDSTPEPVPEVSDELMTPELIEQIEREQIDPLAPPQVHMIWIGDVRHAPENHTKYAEYGFQLTVHTDVNEILAGFQPFVERAYRLALPRVVGFDFLKFVLLYKYGGLAVDADTEPTINATDLHFPSDCSVVFGKEAPPPVNWTTPVFRQTGGPDYGRIRPYQILNWAMAAAAPRNPHIKRLLEIAMMRFLGLRDMEATLIQDIAGSGLMTDYVALLHERQGRSYRDVYNDHTRHFPVDGMCLTTAHYHSMWLKHMNLASWKEEAGV